ncbi:hypothetical protein AUC43_15480 [Hymenobacter sedentarius]|uniref:Cytochrome b561 domain-containing protein n=1 Tax=Hymenobacter sedentarius TaxID=1411621 RepID=A0A0U4ADW3_9BACT|nr:hypothetical protein [Hymenobacter sedentarius]ALW86364.1 hypothetical protein AUC43_15480 [Hymenobacter sedentarius]
MLYASIALFVLAAVFGATILITWLNKKNAPRAVVYTHGLLAVSGLLVLLYYAFTHPTAYPKLAIGLFIITALGGIYMFLVSGPDKAKPIPIGGLHALLAVSSLVTLLVFVFG